MGPGGKCPSLRCPVNPNILYIRQNKDDINALLLTKDKQVPLLWNVLANKYSGRLAFAHNLDRKGRSSTYLGLAADEGSENEASKLLVYGKGSIKAFKYEGRSITSYISAPLRS